MTAETVDPQFQNDRREKNDHTPAQPAVTGVTADVEAKTRQVATANHRRRRRAQRQPVAHQEAKQ